MLVGFTRALVFVALAALLGSIECDASCAAVDCGVAQAPSSGCPHHNPTSDKRAPCLHQHTGFVAPEMGVVKHTLAQADALPLALTYWATVSQAPAVELASDTGSPPPIFILRI